MIPLVDMHCHLLAGLDDGPRSQADAVQMCKDMVAEGVQMAAALAHQNEHYPDVTPERIRTAVRELTGALAEAEVPLTVFPTAEVMANPDIEGMWRQGALLSVADRKKYLLVEMPHGLFVDLCHTVTQFRQEGVSVILAHPERSAELLHDEGRIEQLVRLGCLVQVSSGSVTKPRDRRDASALKSWFRRGIVHLLGSDGHSPNRRPPRMAAAYRQIVTWAGNAVADRVGSTNGLAVLHGLPFHAPEPQPRRMRWLARFW
ncbi:MAG: protein tyrosine phosphatase [Gemmataceae bacterium]|nr:protein tyrosine phosphatase [Gemmataceae bacterium]